MNKNRTIFVIVLVLLAVFFMVTIFFSGTFKPKPKDLPPGTHGVVITDVIQTNNYTYLQVEEIKNKFWIAIVKTEAKPGDSLYYTRSAEMKNFESKELGRTFPSIFFVDDPSKKLLIPDTGPKQMTPQKVKIVRWSEVSVPTPKGGITLSELFKNKSTYAGKTVTIRGKVVRYNHEVMHKNWVHIQDGTEFSDKFDLAITTMDSLTVGNTATFKGVINLDKDFGAGYVYEIIMEDAKASDIN